MSKFTTEFKVRTAPLPYELPRSEGVPREHGVGRALAPCKRAVEAGKQGRRLAITDAQDHVFRELVP